MIEFTSAQQKAMQDLQSLGIIENVHKTAFVYAFKRKLPWTIGIVITALLLFFLSPIFPALALIFYYAYVHSKVHAEFMKQFATNNGMEYLPQGYIDMVRGRLFSVGHSQTITHVLSGTYASHPTKLFNFKYSVGSGKHKQTYFFTVLEIAFEKTVFPHILLQSKTMSKFGYTDAIGKVQDREIKLENHFSKNFNLYCTSGYEIEVLQIFTPDVLSFLQEKSSAFSIEFAENRMYIYDDTVIVKNSQLAEMLEVTKKIFDLIGPLCNRLEDDFRALHPYYKNQQ
jgi:hypothetical protein